ncbi:MAG TPA: adenosylcobinamide-GDP ribazoletransferase [Dissulfurispiraceae bacterium]|nr:adenosylcobinamide-GDP ribazoletransferase [Dissulfurispiraceae bacterium]
MRSFLLALQFLSIVPVRISGTVEERELGRSSAWYVAVGMLQGALLLAVDYAMGNVFHPDIVAALLVLALIVSNGAFHLDGLADTADALAVKSGGNRQADRQRRLAVMKDPTTGPTGVTVLVMVLLLKYLSIRSSANLLPFTYYSTLVVMPMISKWCMVVAMYHGTAARQNGLGRVFLESVRMPQFAAATALFLAPVTLLALTWGRFGDLDPLLFYPLLLAGGYLMTLAWVSFCKNRFGGLTGDTFGALSEGIELIFLMVVLAWSRLSISFATA